ncbi:serine proteinase inhibitor [Oesophagostomum dentatum]|uniref:Serine proteinase inhibitor n=1 Tax=Oesophagostomum dentatum TaxID=61180 RepID=A0A0B1THS8_OESDE|nr:serine proteinase inhibitor [Oesophagostomum dentatum]
MALTTGMNSAFLNAETDFGLDMIRQSPANVQLVVSPLSVIFALTMIQAGAKGKTKTQINQVISKGASDNEITNFYSTLSQDIGKASNGVQTRIANAFFLDMKYRIEKQYADTITRKYGAKIDALNFAQTAQTAKTINAFISKTTAGKIDDLVTEDMVRGAFSLVVNAIYFTAKWEYEFDKSSTSNLTFYSSSNKQRKIEFLNEFGKNRMYAEDRDMQVLSLRYKDTSYAFNVFLPKVRYGLDALRKKLTGATIQKLLSQLRSTYMTISLPKMKIETDFKLKKALMAMGVTEMFSDNADLSGITKLLPLKVSDAVHKAIIEVRLLSHSKEYSLTLSLNTAQRARL